MDPSHDAEEPPLATGGGTTTTTSSERETNPTDNNTEEQPQDASRSPTTTNTTTTDKPEGVVAAVNTAAATTTQTTTSVATPASPTTATATATMSPPPTTTTGAYREISDPLELESIVQQNPVLRDIRAAGAAAKREEVYPRDNTAEYVYTFLEHFPPHSFALPQSFRKVIKGLHAGHWLSKKIDEIKNRRWRTYKPSVEEEGNDSSSSSSSHATGNDFGKLSAEEVANLKRCNMAFWELFIQQKPPPDVLRKRQEQYDKKKAHNLRKSMGGGDSAATSTSGAAGGEDSEGNAPAPSTVVYHEVVDPTELEAIVQQNPVLRDIRAHGAQAKREDVYPSDSTAEYVYTFLQHFPPNSFALPQTFRKVIKGLHAGHWLSKKIEEIKNRRWRGYKPGDPPSNYGKLSPEEAFKIMRCNLAFWSVYIQKKPPDDVLRKRQEQYDKKTAHNKSSRALGDQKAAETVTTIKREKSGDVIHTKMVATVADNDSANEAGVGEETNYTEIVDPTAVERLEEIVKMNPVLLKIREYGPTAKREDVFPTSRYVPFMCLACSA